MVETIYEFMKHGNVNPRVPTNLGILLQQGGQELSFQRKSFFKPEICEILLISEMSSRRPCYFPGAKQVAYF